MIGDSSGSQLAGSWDSVFEPTPTEWGLRGDPFVWFAMRAYLGSDVVPPSTNLAAEQLQRAFRHLVGIDLQQPDLPEAIYKEGFAFGGMSSGQISLWGWRDVLVPLLVDRVSMNRPGVSGDSLA